MKVSERYQTANDAQQQLHNTIVVLDGFPTHLHSTGDGWEFKITKVIEPADGGLKRWSERARTGSIKECDLQLEPIKLGYINDNSGTARYLQRKPLRKWKQGLYSEYLRVKQHDKMEAIGRALGSEFIRQLLRSYGFVEMFYGEYPKFYRAYSLVRLLGRNSVAFSRDWAFVKGQDDEADLRPRKYRHPLAKNPPPMEHRNINIAYKGEVVGECDGENIKLLKKYEYLLESFTEAMIHAS